MRQAWNPEREFQAKAQIALEDMQEGTMFWRPFRQGNGVRSYGMNTFVHFLIDTCASLALLFRVDWIPVAPFEC